MDLRTRKLMTMHKALHFRDDTERLYVSRRFDYREKWYMQHPESVLENETHKVHWDFEIQTDYPISARRPDLVRVKKKKK